MAITKVDVMVVPAGDPERVVLHAAWQHSRGRGPSMSFLGERNPRKALRLAWYVLDMRYLYGTKASSRKRTAKDRRRSWCEMTTGECRRALRQIVATSSSEGEVRDRLRDELDYTYSVAMTVCKPEDAEGREARSIVEGLGGPIMADGSMVMLMAYAPDGKVMSL